MSDTKCMMCRVDESGRGEPPVVIVWHKGNRWPCCVAHWLDLEDPRRCSGIVVTPIDTEPGTAKRSHVMRRDRIRKRK